MVGLHLKVINFITKTKLAILAFLFSGDLVEKPQRDYFGISLAVGLLYVTYMLSSCFAHIVLCSITESDYRICFTRRTT